MWMSVDTGVWLPCLSCRYNVIVWGWDIAPQQPSREQFSNWLIIRATSDFFCLVFSWDIFPSDLLICVVILISEMLVFVRAIIQTTLLWWKTKNIYEGQFHLSFVLCVAVAITGKFCFCWEVTTFSLDQGSNVSLAPYFSHSLKHQMWFWWKHSNWNNPELHEGLNLESNFWP